MNAILLNILLIAGIMQPVPIEGWETRLETDIMEIENTINGDIGLYVKHLSDNGSVEFNTDEYWYLSSTIKVPLAIAILQKVEAGELSLDDKLTLKVTDFVDGSGDMLWEKPGSEFTIAELIHKMLKNSDSTATDMLLRLLGEEEFNQQIQQHIVSEGINRITTIMQVRYDAYSEIHENVMNLSNMDIVRVNSSSTLTERFNALVQVMGIKEDEWKASSIDEAFDRYYERGINTADLSSMGLMLERLYRGELLNPEHTSLLMDIMADITTGDRRIKAGLPEGTRFAQKTGTQIRRACNIGIVFDEEGLEPIVVAACIKDFDRIADAEKAFEEIGRSLSRIFLENAPPLSR